VDDGTLDSANDTDSMVFCAIHSCGNVPQAANCGIVRRMRSLRQTRSSNAQKQRVSLLSRLIVKSGLRDGAFKYHFLSLAIQY